MDEGDDADPFGMFGDDDVEGSDDEQGDGANRQAAAQELINATCDRVPTTTVDHATRQDSTNNRAPAAYDSDLLRSDDGYKPVSLPWRNPSYLSPQVRLASMASVGGGRGYVVHLDAPDATIPAGTLVMVEEPLLEWPDEQIGRELLGLVLVRHLIQHVDATSLHDLEHLHPTKAAVDRIETLDPNNDEGRDRGGAFEEQVGQMMRNLRERYPRDDPRVREIVALAERRGLANSGGAPFDAADCLRLLLALRYNGLQSGVYVHVAMLNHSDQPNCVKFMPEWKNQPQSNGRGVGDTMEGNTGRLLYSEVRTTRTVRHGEALTIRYVPSIRSHATRRHELWEQHRFDIGDSVIPSSLHGMELVHGEIPKSVVDRRDDSSVTSQVERATEDLQQLYHDMRTSLPLKPAPAAPTVETSEGQLMIEQIRMLEVASDELVASAGERLGNRNHILLIPCLELHLDCANLVLQFDAALQPRHRVQLLSRMVQTSIRLADLQTALHGPDHYDLARTHLDVAQSIEELLSRSPPTLYSLGQDVGVDGATLGGSNPQALPTTFASWSAREHQARKEYSRIKGLYPRDVDQYVT